MTHLETSEKASEQMAGQGTNLMRMCPRAAGKWASMLRGIYQGSLRRLDGPEGDGTWKKCLLKPRCPNL